MRLIKLGLFSFVAGLALASCSSNDEKKALEPLPLVEIEQKVHLKTLWSSNVGEGQKKKTYSVPIPAIEGQRIFSADFEGNVFAFDINNGKTLWKKSLEVFITASASVNDGKVFVGSADGEIIALNAEDGSELWRAEVSSEVLAPPQSNGNVLAVTSIDGSLTVLKAETGEKLWSYGHVVPTLTNRGLAAPIITSTQVIGAFDNGQLLAFNAADGSSLWETRIAQPTGRHDLERIVDIDGTPVQNGGFIYAASYQGAIAAVARAQGRLVWKQNISTYLPLVVENRKVFATAADGTVIAYHANTGVVEWQNAQMLRRTIGAPAVIGDYIAVLDSEGYMHILNQSDGQFAGRISVKGKHLRSPMVSHGGKLFVLSGNGKLTAYTLKN